MNKIKILKVFILFPLHCCLAAFVLLLQSVRLDDKVRYKELLQQFTTVPLEQETVVQRPVQPQPIKHPVPQLPR